MADPNTAQQKLIQYLTEAHGKEKELETSLTAHIGMATRPTYKKRLQQHLKETKQHAKQVERRMKKLGAGTNIQAKATELASRGVAAAKGPLHAVRGTGESEMQLKNALTEYSEEHDEIARYTAIEILATEVGDTETAKLAKAIRREEERMASFLEKQIPQLTKQVVKDEIPREERKQTGGGRKRSSGTRASSRSSSTKKSGSGSSSSRSRSSSSKSSSTGSKASARSRSGGTRKSSGSSSSRSRGGSSTTRSSSSRSGGSSRKSSKSSKSS